MLALRHARDAAALVGGMTYQPPLPSGRQRPRAPTVILNAVKNPEPSDHPALRSTQMGFSDSMYSL